MAASGRLAARKWAVGLGEGATAAAAREVADPLGFSRSGSGGGGSEQDEGGQRQKKEVDASWKQQKAWEAAQAPFKNLFMIAFMMWMAGSTVHLFSIGITFSALWQPISALQGMGKLFEPFKDARVDTLPPKLTFIALNLAGLVLGLWKLNSLGLLPTHASDWVSNLPPPPSAEFSGGGLLSTDQHAAAAAQSKPCALLALLALRCSHDLRSELSVFS